MKKPLVILLVIISACGAKQTAQKDTKDTVDTWATYKFNGLEARTSLVKRIVRDSFMDVKIDSFTTKKQVAKSTHYLIPIVDTARIMDTATKQAIVQRDSLGRPQFQLRWYTLHDSLILQDFKKNQ